jgi:hypothetical protein
MNALKTYWKRIKKEQDEELQKRLDSMTDEEKKEWEKTAKDFFETSALITSTIHLDY